MNHVRIAVFGPRQMGKATLLLEEIMPALTKAGVLPLYIECWADKAILLLGKSNCIGLFHVLDSFVHQFPFKTTSCVYAS
ncbi:hypothetical protein [Roseateles oligotrophus]|uniref:AAA domain-containing protein n=1 Tax=Roseateles oligotrophus TaxID=1769250 RepID=A0ABT2YC95_9BURK|nr:hypothetical protein [Roseateles oligotrophus]MCV2367665.1 hypothetical protein [Roseateles oligotrophus]